MHTHAAHCAWSVRRVPTSSGFVSLPARASLSVREPVRPVAVRRRLTAALALRACPLRFPAQGRRRDVAGGTRLAGREQLGPPARGPYRTRGHVPLVFTSRHGNGLHRSESELRGLTRQAPSSRQGRGPCIGGCLDGGPQHRPDGH